MALVPCFGCRQPVAQSAATCPKCQWPRPADSALCERILAVLRSPPKAPPGRALRCPECNAAVSSDALARRACGECGAALPPSGERCEAPGCNESTPRPAPLFSGPRPQIEWKTLCGVHGRGFGDFKVDVGGVNFVSCPGRSVSQVDYQGTVALDGLPVLMPPGMHDLWRRLKMVSIAEAHCAGLARQDVESAARGLCLGCSRPMGTWDRVLGRTLHGPCEGARARDLAEEARFAKVVATGGPAAVVQAMADEDYRRVRMHH